MPTKNRKPRKSLRTLLIIWFLAFSIVPLAFLTGYSLIKYEQALDLGTLQTVVANSREISIILTQFQEKSCAVLRVARMRAIEALIYQLSTNNISTSARELLQRWLPSSWRNAFGFTIAMVVWKSRFTKTSMARCRAKPISNRAFTLERRIFFKRVDSPDEIPFFNLQSHRSGQKALH